MDIELLSDLDVATINVEIIHDVFGLIVDALDREGFSQREETVNKSLAVNFAARFHVYMSALCLLSGQLCEASEELNRIKEALYAEKAT